MLAAAMVPVGLLGSFTRGELRDLVEDVLTIARERTGMEIGWLSEFVGDEQVFRVVAGDRAGWALHDDSVIRGADGYCQRMLDGRIPGVVADARREPALRDLPVTGSLDMRGYIGVPVVLGDGSPFGTLCCSSHRPCPSLRDRDRDLLSVLARVIARDLDLRAAEAQRRREHAQLSAGKALVAALEARDRYTGDHSQLVTELALDVAARLGLDEDALREIEQVAVLHDIGKVGIPDSVLQHPGPLDEVGWASIREHPLIAERIVASIPELRYLGAALRAEHERWDGTGYPDGLAGEAIPLASRIALVCDAYHAMTSDRPYRPALPLSEALAELQAHSGTQFWPVAVEALLAGMAERAHAGL